MELFNSLQELMSLKSKKKSPGAEEMPLSPLYKLNQLDKYLEYSMGGQWKKKTKLQDGVLTICFAELNTRLSTYMGGRGVGEW